MDTHTEDMPLVAKKKDKGFTLVELLIVIVILGILATVTVFAVRGLTTNAKTNACATEKSTIGTAAEAYFAQYGGNAIPVTGGTLPAGAGWALGATPGATLAAAGLLRTAPTLYSVSADGNTLTVTAAGTTAGCT